MRLRTLIISGLLFSLCSGPVFAKTSVPSYGYDWIRISGKPLHVERVENYVYTNVQQLDRTSPYSYEQLMLKHIGGAMDENGNIRFYAYGKRTPGELAEVEQHNGIFDFTQYATEDAYPLGAPSSPYPNDASYGPTPSLPYTNNEALNGPEANFAPENMKPPVVTPEPETPKPPVVTPEPETPKPPVVTPEPETPKPPVVTPNPETPKPEPEPEQPPVSSSVSAWEREVWSLTNAERKKAGLSAFTLDSKLSTVARTKSQDM
ncbi:MAG: hypothetical protein ACRC5C_14540, partial [Bacilli bacterium]